MLRHSLIIIIVTICFPLFVSAQAGLDFILKDAIDLPGYNVLSLVIEDVNNDDFMDYCYRDNGNFYFIDGTDLSTILTVPRNDYYRFKTGDLNNDGLKDIGLISEHQIKFYLAPDFTQILQLTIPSYVDLWHQTIGDIYFSHIFDMDLVYVGTSLERSYSQPWPDYAYAEYDSGQVLIYSFDGNEFSQANVYIVYGKVQQIDEFSRGDARYLLIRTMGNEFYDVGWPLCDYSWADLFAVTSFNGILNIWSVGAHSGYTYGSISNVFIGKPYGSGDDLFYFNSDDDADDSRYIVCMDNPDGNIYWYRSHNSNSEILKNITLSEIYEQGPKELMIYKNTATIRNSINGDSISAENFTPPRGEHYKLAADLEGDGIDEFFFYEGGEVDSLYIYNIQTTTGIKDDESSMPRKSSILENYPNPFNAQTTISYSLPEAGEVTISVYNLLGQRVAILLEGRQQAGEHTVVWDATEFPSGVYFARLETAKRSESIKMVFLK